MPLLLCLLLTAAPQTSGTVTVAPAPGAPPAEHIVLFGRETALDAAGRAQIPPAVSPTGDGLRFYRTAAKAYGGEQVFYYPEDGTLASWTLTGVESDSSAEIAIKDHANAAWESAKSYAAPLEPAEGGRRVRFVLPPGRWDVSAVVPGYAPAFALDLKSNGSTLEVPAAKAAPAGRVTARILDSRTGKPPERWEAYAARIGGDPKSEEAKFFEKRPIASGQATLDYASLPVGRWELRIAAPGRSEPRVAARLPKAGSLAALGDVYVTDFGRLRLVVEFPDEVPEGELEIQLTRSRYRHEGGSIPLVSRRASPRAETVLEFTDVEPGDIEVECTDAEAGVRGSQDVVVEPDRTAEVRMAFRPVLIRGTVRHGKDVVAGAELQSPSGNGDAQARTVTSDELGAYALRAWAGARALLLATTSPGEKAAYLELLTIPPGAREHDHDVLLPASEIRGIVRDAETGSPIAGATVWFETATPDEEPADPDNYTAFSLSQKTDDEGRFRLANLDDAKIDVSVQGDGYSPGRFPAVQPTPDGVDLDVRLEKGMTLSGIVTDETGAPVAGVNVGLDTASRGITYARETTSGADGRYEFKSVDSGVHTLGLLTCGHTIVLRRVDVPKPEAGPARGATEDIRLAPESAPVTVLVRNHDGTPNTEARGFRWSIDGLALPAEPWYAFATLCGTAPDGGRIVLHGLPPSTIGALSDWSNTVLGTFQYDGTQTTWTIRLPDPEGKHLDVSQQAAK